MSDKVALVGMMDEFGRALAAGLEGFARAAAVYVAALDKDPRNADAFRDKFADVIPASAWSGFEAVGRKWMHPRLLMGSGGRYASKIKRLPYSTQERIFEGERFEVTLPGGDVLKVDIREATPEQVEQLLDGTHVRTPSEQRAWMESRAAVKSVDAEVLPYTMSDGKVTFRRGVSLTRAELKRILQEM